MQTPTQKQPSMHELLCWELLTPHDIARIQELDAAGRRLGISGAVGWLWRDAGVAQCPKDATEMQIGLRAATVFKDSGDPVVLSAVAFIRHKMMTQCNEAHGVRGLLYMIRILYGAEMPRLGEEEEETVVTSLPAVKELHSAIRRFSRLTHVELHMALREIVDTRDALMLNEAGDPDHALAYLLGHHPSLAKTRHHMCTIDVMRAACTAFQPYATASRALFVSVALVKAGLERHDAAIESEIMSWFV